MAKKIVKGERISIRVTKHVKTKIEKAADKCNMRLGDYVIKCALGDDSYDEASSYCQAQFQGIIDHAEDKFGSSEVLDFIEHEVHKL